MKKSIQDTLARLSVIFLLPIVLITSTQAAEPSKPVTTDAKQMVDQTSPQFCGSCHPRIFKEWQSSRMGQDINNDKVYQFYAGVHGDGTKDNLGFQPFRHGAKGDCADCHVPMLVLSEHKKGHEVDLGIAMKEKKDHGISCILCHSVKDVHINKDENGKYKTRIFDSITLGSADTRYGPIKDAKSPVHKSEYSAGRYHEICICLARK